LLDFVGLFDQLGGEVIHGIGSHGERGSFAFLNSMDLGAAPVGKGHYETNGAKSNNNQRNDKNMQ
jgi:hypothetical protein